MGRSYHSPRSGVAGGLIVVGIGVLMLLHQNGILRISDIWRLWPLVLVAGGVVRLIQFGSTNRFLGGLMIVLGLVLTAAEFHLIPYGVWELWPLGIIAVGLLLLWRSLQPREEREPFGKFEYSAATPDNVSIFGGGERRISMPDFQRADVLAIFGGYKLDLRKAGMKGSTAVVDATAIFGGVEILVPEHWNVQVRGVGVFGGYGDESHHPGGPEPCPDLVVEGVAIFGGVSIKN